MCKTHLDKTLHPAPFLSSSAPSLSAWGSACGWPVSRTPPLGTPTRLYVPLLPAWHGLAVGELPTVKDAPVPSSMAARSPSRDPSTASWNPAASSCAWRARSRKGSPSPLCLEARHPALQRALRGRAEAKKQQEQDDLERFMRTFVAEGGDPRDAEEEWRGTRSKHAAQSKRAKAEGARLSMYQSRMRAV
jgi:hypothetical protein